MFVLDEGKRFVIPRTEMTYPGHNMKLHQNAADPIKAPVDHVMMDFEDLVAKKSMLGSAGVIVMDETVNMVQACLNIARFYAHESCGQCTPCREGTVWLVKILTRLVLGKGKDTDIDMLLEITDNIGGLIDFSKGSFGKTICPFGEAVAWPVRSFVEKFESEFRNCIQAKKVFA